jgi:hypothetical protein
MSRHDDRMAPTDEQLRRDGQPSDAARLGELEREVQADTDPWSIDRSLLLWLIALARKGLRAEICEKALIDVHRKLRFYEVEDAKEIIEAIHLPT